MAYDEQYFLQCFGSKGYEIYVKDPILYKYKKFLYYKDIKTFYSLICEIFYAHWWFFKVNVYEQIWFRIAKYIIPVLIAHIWQIVMGALLGLVLLVMYFDDKA